MGTDFRPYVGPRSFGTEDRAIFFGRNTEAEELVALILAHPIILIYAQSGAGKTSLLNAKLVPMLEREGATVLGPVRVQKPIPQEFDVTQASNIFAFNVLRGLATESTGMTELTSLTVSDYIKRFPVDQPRVLVFDQFEELFTSYPERWQDRHKFFEQLESALKTDPKVRCVLAMREEYIAQLEPHCSLLPENLRTRFYLQGLRPDKALEAITKPLRNSGYSFAKNVAEGLRDELLKIPIKTPKGAISYVQAQFVEPLQLQVVCQTVWENLPKERHVIDQDHVDAFGHVANALLVYYTSCIEAVTKETKVNEYRLRQWFDEKLITPASTRSMVYRDKTTTDGIPDAVIDFLDNKMHLIRPVLRTGSQSDDDSQWYELAHTQLVEPIQKANKNWFSQLPGAQVLAEELRKRAQDGGPLLSDFEVSQANLLLASEAFEEGETEHDLIDLVERSKAELKRQADEFALRQEAQRKISFWTRIALGAVCLALLVSWWQMKGRSELENKHIAMDTATTLAFNAKDSMEQSGPDKNAAMLAALDGGVLCLQEGICLPKETVATMNAAAQRVSQFLETPSRTKEPPSVEKPLPFIPFLPTPDGKVMISVETENTPIVWNKWTLEPLRLPELPAKIHTVGVKQNLGRIAVKTVDGRIWMAELPKRTTGVLGYFLNFLHSLRTPNWNEVVPTKSLEELLDLKGKNESQGRRLQAAYLLQSPNGEPLQDYRLVIKDWLLDTAGQINRPYTDDERLAFPSAKSGETFSDRVFAAFTAKKDNLPDAQKSLDAILHEFRFPSSDSPRLLARLYVTDARLNILNSAFEKAAQNYERAAALDLTLSVGNKAQALRSFIKGNGQAEAGYQPDAEKSYEEAIRQDESLKKLIGDPAKASQKTDLTPEVQTILDNAKNLGIAGKSDQARAEYEKAKHQAPNALSNLNPDEAIKKLAPKGPSNTPPPSPMPENNPSPKTSTPP